MLDSFFRAILFFVCCSDFETELEQKLYVIIMSNLLYATHFDVLLPISVGT
jgi:hypothetical protein